MIISRESKKQNQNTACFLFSLPYKTQIILWHFLKVAWSPVIASDHKERGNPPLRAKRGNLNLSLSENIILADK